MILWLNQNPCSHRDILISNPGDRYSPIFERVLNCFLAELTMSENYDSSSSKLDYVRRKWCIREDVVISGMSGRFPKSQNIKEFTDNLFDGIDMMTSGNDRFQAGTDGFPSHSGKVENLHRFDAQFFNIPHKHAHWMDPQLRKLLEVSFEAIVDAGLEVRELNGSKTGFYYGSCFKETELALLCDPNNITEYLQDYPSIISRTFGLKGPVAQFDTACGSSFSALNEAFIALKTGICDKALVASYNICLIPKVTLAFRELMMVSTSGRSRCLDESADGYGRSEAVCCIVLQLKSEAKRIYSTIANSRSNADGYKEQGPLFPALHSQRRLMAETYDEIDLDPNTISYIEGHITGTQAGDPVETQAIHDVFCQKRSSDDPLMIGCLKSNMGHAETAAGLCAIVKANIIFQCGSIPPNIHFKKPNPKINVLTTGKMRPVIEKIPFKGKYIALNCLGFGGSNAHIVLRGHEVKSIMQLESNTKISRLVPICSRTLEGVRRIQQFLEENRGSITPGFLDLFYSYSKTASMPYKSYSILEESKIDPFYHSDIVNVATHNSQSLAIALPSHSIKFDEAFRNIPLFSSLLDSLSKHSDCMGIDLISMILGESSPNCLTEKIVATVASQLLLVNCFEFLGIQISSLIGCPLSELTKRFKRSMKEALNLAFWLGSIIDDGKIASNRSIKIRDLKVRDNRIYVITSGDYINRTTDTDQKIIHEKNPTEFNNSTSISFLDPAMPTETRNILGQNWEILVKSEDLQISSQFSDNCNELLPMGSILIHFESQPIKTPHQIRVQLNRSSCLRVEEFLKTIGELYTMDLPVDAKLLYPPVDSPVPVNTLSLHSLITFDHSQEFSVFKYPEYFNFFSQSSKLFQVSLTEPEDCFLADHVVDGRIIFPATGIIMQVWLTVSKFHQINPRKSKILFRDVSFTQATTLTDKSISFRVEYMPHNNSFFTSENGSLVACGKVFVVENIGEIGENFSALDSDAQLSSEMEQSPLELSREDIYKELRIRGYDYGCAFQCLTRADIHGNKGKVEWKEVSLSLTGDTMFEKMYGSKLGFLKTWITYCDSVMQFETLSNQWNRSLCVPVGIESMLIDAEKVTKKINELNGVEKPYANTDEEVKMVKDGIIFDVSYEKATQTLKSEGLWIRGLKASIIPRKSQKVVIETREFVPLNEEIRMDTENWEKLNDYREICRKFSSSIHSHAVENKLGKDPENQTFSKSDFGFELDTPASSLLNCLIDISNGHQVEVKTGKIDQDILMGKDLVFNGLQRFLRPFLQIPIEEKCYHGQANVSLVVMEKNDGQSSHFEMIKYLIDSVSLGTCNLSDFIHASCGPLPIAEKIPPNEYSHIEWEADSFLGRNIPQVDLLIYQNHATDISSFSNKIKYLIDAIKPNGFLLVIFREKIHHDIEEILTLSQLDTVLSDIKASCMDEEDVISLMKKTGWICVSNRIIEPQFVSIRGLLFRREIDSSMEPKVVHVSPFDFEWVEELKELLEQAQEDEKICLVSHPCHDQAVFGFTKSIRMESAGDRIICLANRYFDDGIDLEAIDWQNSCFKGILERGLKFNIYDPTLGWGGYNHFEVDKKLEEDSRCLIETSDDVQLQVLRPGDLSSLKWCKMPILNSSISNTSVNICYASINFKDVLLTSGRLPIVIETNSRRESFPSNKIGFEYSGYDGNNNRIMGITSHGAMTTRMQINPDGLIWPVPEEWSLEDAATVPVVYATVIYGLIMRGNLRQGESVLIHAGSGGVGMAAIELCLSYGCKVFTTVGTSEKRKFILERFPQLKDTHIGNSRDTSFEELILCQTDGRGVDVVLNSLADDKLQASVRCLASGGRFLEIGKYDGYKNSPVNLGLLDGGRTFHGVMLDSFFISNESMRISREIKQLKDLFTKFVHNGIMKPLPRKVFQMDQVESAFRFMASGKHIGKILIKITDADALSEASKICALRTIEFSPDKVYIIIGGFGGFGLEIAMWLVSKEARNIVLNSRNGPKSSYHKYCVDRMIEMGVNVIISKHDLTTEKGAQELFDSMILPVGGIFNSAMLMHDALLVEQTHETFAKVCASKVNITINMDRLSRQKCPSLDYFVVFSSIASGRGNIGQTNYSLGNSFMESVCERRRRDRLHGLTIQWGYVGDVGFVVEKLGIGVEFIQGTAPQRLHSCYATLERALIYDSSVVSSFVRHEDRKKEFSGDIIKSIGHILGLEDINSCDKMITLGELGLDSLMSIEIQQTLDRYFGVSMTSREVRLLKVCDLMDLSDAAKSLSSLEHDQQKIETQKKYDLATRLFEPTVKLNDGTGDILFVFPAIEEDFLSYGKLFENIQHSVIGLHWTYDLLQLDSIEKVAQVFANRMTRLTNNTELKVIGYSFGGLLALAIAKIFERHELGPRITKLILLDAEVEFIKRHFIEVDALPAAFNTEKEYEQEFIRNCLKRYCKDTSSLDVYLQKANTRAERFEAATNFLISQGTEPFHAENLMKMSKIAFQKSNLIWKNDLQLPLHCKMIHLKASENIPCRPSDGGNESNINEHSFAGNHHDFISKNLHSISEKISEFIKS